jgi:glycosyltransferase involved in cell wall biosynthesis
LVSRDLDGSQLSKRACQYLRVVEFFPVTHAAPTMRVGIDLSPLQVGNLTRGIGIYAENLLLALSEISQNIEYVLLTSGPFAKPEWAKDLNPSFQWVQMPAVHAGRASFFFASQVVLPAQAKQLGLDVLHCICIPTNGSQPGIPYRQTVPTVVTVHDLAPLILIRNLLPRFYQQWFYRFQLQACRRAAHLISDSHSTENEILRHQLAPRQRITTAQLAAPVFRNPAREEKLLDPPLPYLLHVGGADYQKNQKTVLMAFASLCKNPQFNHNLVLVGTNHITDDDVRGSEGRVFRYSGVSRTQLQHLYRGCTAFLFPSLHEGFGLPVLEAMSCGAPVIASRIAVIEEVAADAAILIDPTNSDELANLIQSLITNDALRKQYIEAGYKRVGTFSWIRTAEIMVETYRRVSGF